jgi:hypothetical protein
VNSSRSYKWVIIGAIALILASVAAILVLLNLRPAATTISAVDLAREAATDPAAEAKYSGRWLQVKGKVVAVTPVPGDERPYTTVELESGQPLDLQAAFDGENPRVPAVGAEVVIEGRVALCMKGSVLLERCVLISP